MISPRQKKTAIVITVIVIGVALYGLLSPTAQAQFGGPIVIIQDIPRQTAEVKQSITDRLKGLLDRSIKIAYKNSLRVFLGKLAEDTAIWVSSAGTGQKPLFLDDPGKYFASIGSAAAGDFADTLSTQFLGISLCQPNLEGQLQLEIGLRSLLNPATFCQDSCQSTYNSKVQTPAQQGKVVTSVGSGILNRNNKIDNGEELFFYESETQRLQKLATGNTGTETTLRCYVDLSQFYNQTGPPAPSDYVIDPATEEYETLSPTGCLQLYQYFTTRYRQDSQRELNRCTQACTYGKRTARCTLDQIGDNLKNLNSSDFSKAVSVYFDTGQNQIGQLLKLYTEALTKSQTAQQNERDIYQFGNIGPIRSAITGRILTPADLTSARATLPIDKSTVAEETFTGITEDVLRGAAGVFTNTLVGKLIERFFNSKCGLNPDACSGPSGARTRLGSLLFNSPTGIAAARLQFASLAKINYIIGDPSRDEVLVTDELVSRGIIDNRFKQAIDEGLTVQEAMDKGLLDPNKTFGFTANGTEPRDGYPFTSLLYLRKYRIIPVGWELAARYSQISSNAEDLSLEKLVDRYSQCAPQEKKSCSNDPATTCGEDADCNQTATCNSDSDCAAPYNTCRVSSTGIGRCQVKCTTNADCSGSPTGATCSAGFCTSGTATCQPVANTQVPVSPYCGLVDPNWVLKAPQTYCQRQGAGEEIINRQFVCDEDTNGDGKIVCTGDTPDIGHWIIERRTDTCADERSCIAENEDGSCRAYGYCFEERPTWKFNGERCDQQYVSCDSFTNADGVQVAYLTNTLDHYNDTFCNGAAGCQWYCQAPAYNASNSTGSCTPSSTGDKIYLTRAAESCSASDAGCNEFVRPGTTANLLRNGDFELIGPSDNRDDGIDDHFPGTGVDSWLIHHTPAQSTNEIQATSDAYIGDTAALVRSNGSAGSHFAMQIDTGYPVNGRTFTFSFYAKADGACTVPFGIQYWDTSGGVFGTFQNAVFNAGGGWQRFSLTSQVPETPVGENNGMVEPMLVNYNIGCTVTIDGAMLQEVAGATTFSSYTDAPKVYLNGNRVSCTADEVGCELYKPSNGGQNIPAVARATDQCSEDVVGCQAWTETALTGPPARPQQTVNFVDNTGQQCSAQYVGCEEYTNLNKVAQGGEAKEYYTHIDQCVTTNNTNLGTFYTWEGNDVTGYQLRSHQFLLAGDGSPCTSINQGTATSEPTCVGTDPTAVCNDSDLAGNPDCIEYFAANSQTRYLRLKSKTIQASATCNPYRNTVDESNGNQVVYYIDSAASAACPAPAAGCREYRGSNGNNIRAVLNDTFEDGDTAGWTGGSISAESVRVGGHSMRLSPNAYYDDVTLEANHSYKLTVWAKGQNGGEQLNAELQTDGGVTLSYLGNVDLKADWNVYTLGPGIAAGALGSGQRIVITGAAGNTLYVDNVQVQDIANTAYVIGGTSRSCDSQDVGCAAYTDRAGQQRFLKSFTRLCSTEVVGCEAVVNTHNSDNPYQEVFSQQGVTVPGDSVERWVVDKGYFCSATAQACEALGKPTINTANTVTGWETTYLKNDPDSYSTILCRPDQLYCEEWTSSSGAQVTFRDPGSNTCQYGAFNSTTQGWTQTNTTYSCPVVTPPSLGRPIGAACARTCTRGDRIGAACVDDTDCPGGGINSCQGNASEVGKSCSTNADCTAPNTCHYLAGLCPVQQAGCNEYRDPADPTGCLTQCPYVENNGVTQYYDQQCQPLAQSNGGLPGCRGYYYLRSTVEDTAAECGSVIDPTLGCRSFYDVSNPNVTFKGSSQ